MEKSEAQATKEELQKITAELDKLYDELWETE